MIYLLFLISFLAAVVLTPVLRKFSIKYKLVDKPGEFKIHEAEISHLGGWGIWLGFIIALLFAVILKLMPFYQFVGLGLGSLVVIFLGFWDDLKWKKAGHPIIKLILQSLVGFLIIFILVKIGINLQFSINSIIIALVAAFYIVGAMNAINMEDGMDGLAGGLTLISLIGFVGLAFLSHNLLALVLVFSLAGSLIGFLIYNCHPASIFMGDNGSHFLGFLLAILAIIFTSHPSYNFKQFIGPILIIGLPVMDAVWVILRRLKEKKLPFVGDRRHLYDRIHQRGVSVPKTVLICYGIQVIIVLGGVLMYYL